MILPFVTVTFCVSASQPILPPSDSTTRASVINSNDNVYEVEFKLDSYCKSLNICINKMNIVLSYNEFGKVDEIASPLNS